MVDGINWQIGLYRQLGFNGYLQVLMAGIGSRPDEYSRSIASYLDGTGDPNATMGRAAVWNKVIDELTHDHDVVVYISSMADGSGHNDVCQQRDQAVDLNDRQIDTWSAARWISYNANRYGLLKMGENPGLSAADPVYSPGMLAAAARQMQACGLQGLMWAHDWNLYDGVGGVTLDAYAATIRQYDG
jgi:hypothetical protein